MKNASVQLTETHGISFPRAGRKDRVCAVCWDLWSSKTWWCVAAVDVEKDIVVSFSGSSVSWPISSPVAFPVAAAFRCLLPWAILSFQSLTLFSSYHWSFESLCATVTLRCCKWAVWGRCNDSLSRAICLTSAGAGPLRATMNQHNDGRVLGCWENKQDIFLNIHNQWWILI